LIGLPATDRKKLSAHGGRLPRKPVPTFRAVDAARLMLQGWRSECPPDPKIAVVRPTGQLPLRRTLGGEMDRVKRECPVRGAVLENARK
jgi:hypothetical protein